MQHNDYVLLLSLTFSCLIISNIFGYLMQPVLAVMYLVQYMPTVGYWLMDKVSSIPLNQ